MRLIVLSVLSFVLCFAESGSEKKFSTVDEYIAEYTKTGEYKKVRFTEQERFALCSKIGGRKFHKEISPQIDLMIKRTGISKELWNNIYVHNLQCSSATIAQHALFDEYKDFVAIVEYGANLELAYEDLDGDISTFKDFIFHQMKIKKGLDKRKWAKIHKYLKRKKVKGCKDLPHIKCTAPYIKYD